MSEVGRVSSPAVVEDAADARAMCAYTTCPYCLATSDSIPLPEPHGEKEDDVYALPTQSMG